MKRHVRKLTEELKTGKYYYPFRLFFTFVFFTNILLFFAACRSFVDLDTAAKGGIDNPIAADLKAGQVDYLNRLRSMKGESIAYSYYDSIVTHTGRVLERYLIENSVAKEEATIFQLFLDSFRSEPLYPKYYRIYMDGYNPGYKEKQSIKGYRILLSEEKK